MKWICLTIIITLFPLKLLASQQDQFTLASIEIIGNSKTKRQVILTELNLQNGQKLNNNDIEEAVNNLRNTQIFTNVKHHTSGDRKIKKLVIELEERWTTIPIFKIASGGGVSQLTLGVFDPNIWGEYVEAGAQYERLESTNSGVLWLKKPRLFSSRYGVDLQLWKTNRIRTKYSSEAQKAVETTGFLHKRDKVYLGLSREFSNTFTSRAFYEFNSDSFSDEFTTDEIKKLIAITGLPPSSNFHFLGLNADYGRLNFGKYRVDGTLLTGSLSYGHSNDEDTKPFLRSELNLRYYKTVLKKSTLAQRLMTGTTNTKTLQYWYYLGGLNRIRGFSDNRFAGRFFWLSNSEFRHPIFENKWLVLQGATFLDIVNTTEFFKDLDAIGAASAGAGLRIILPKVYRFVVRFDYATPLKKEDDMNFSFGVQQFF